MSKKFKFGYDVSDLTAWVDEAQGQLLTASVYAGKAYDVFEIQRGIKYKAPLNYLDTDVIFAANSGCGTFTATGSTSFTQKEISTDAFKNEQAWCINDLEDYWARTALSDGQYYDTLAFQNEITALYNQKVMKEVEKILWTGNTSTGSGNLAMANGFIKYIDEVGSGVVTGNTTSATGISSSNIITLVDAMIDVIPADVQGADDMVLCVGWDTFRKLLKAERDANNFHINGAVETPYTTGTYTLPTWGIKVEAFHGLDATNRMFLGRKSNFVIGIDGSSDFDSYQMWYDIDTDKLKLRLKARLGTQIKFGSELVEFSL